MRNRLASRLTSTLLSSALVAACADDGAGDGSTTETLTNPTASSSNTAATSTTTGVTQPTTTTPATVTTTGPTGTTPVMMTTTGPTTTTPVMMTTTGPTTTTPATTTDPTVTTPMASMDPTSEGGGANTTPTNSTPAPTMSGDDVEMPPTSSGSGGTGPGPGPTGSDGPCDIYEAAGTPCVAAYSMIRRLSSTYDGPLYQVRSGSSAENTGSGGELHDIGFTADGFADAAAQDMVCAGGLCTVALLYDQSGKGNDLPVAKRGRSEGGTYAGMDDFETIADAGPLTVGGHDVYSLYMEARQGYRQTSPGDGVPRGKEPQGIYMLADGTHYGTACCWDFGNVTPDPTQYSVMNTMFLGVAYWGRGAGNGPWFMADFEAGVWAGGSNPGDPGWGALSEPAPANEQNPSMQVPYALGFLKTGTDYALRMANVETATDVTTAYEGPLPKGMDNQGAIVLGVGGDNSNNSWGTFYEGAVVAGYPTADTELAVMKNIQAAGYGQ